MGKLKQIVGNSDFVLYQVPRWAFASLTLHGSGAFELSFARGWGFSYNVLIPKL